MTLSFVGIQRKKIGPGLFGYRPIIVGQPNDHLMDWRGCNFHYVLFPGMQRRFMSLEVAKAMVRAVEAGWHGEKGEQKRDKLLRYIRHLNGVFGPKDEELVT